jgi:hypothetical protein
MHYQYITNELIAGLLKHQEMQRLYNKYHGETVIDIHKSFANIDKVTALIRKDRVLQFPFGEGFKAVQYEFEIRQRSLGDKQVTITNIFSMH